MRYLCTDILAQGNMLNRRILRIKAFKIMYEYAVRGGMTLAEALSELEKSCEATRDLYLYMLSIAMPLTSEASRRIEAARSKFNPTEEELNPNMKFAGNALSRLLGSDIDFTRLIERKKLSWQPYDILIRKVLDSVQSGDYYRDYMASPDSSLREDCALFRRIYRNEFEDLPELHAILEDQSVYWLDDLGYALTWVCTTLDSLAEGKVWRLPELYQSDEVQRPGGYLRNMRGREVSSDRAFVRKLLTEAFSGYEKTFAKVTESVPEWDKDRLFSADMAIIALGVAEASNFPDIPRNVTLNEYIEISKYYCSPKSRQFINGLLDKLTRPQE